MPRFWTNDNGPLVRCSNQWRNKSLHPPWKQVTCATSTVLKTSAHQECNRCIYPQCTRLQSTGMGHGARLLPKLCLKYLAHYAGLARRHHVAGDYASSKVGAPNAASQSGVVHSLQGIRCQRHFLAVDFGIIRLLHLNRQERFWIRCGWNSALDKCKNVELAASFLIISTHLS